MIETLSERCTKPFILLSLFGAGALTVTTPGDWPALPWVSLAALVGSFVAAGRFPVAVARGCLGLTYLAPGLLALSPGVFQLWDLTPWLAGMVGMMVATADPTRWHLPVRWRVPLVAWGLVVAMSWPVVWLRELDFAPSIVNSADILNNGVGVSADGVLLWVYSVVLTHGVGLLLIDWLFASFSGRDGARLVRGVLTPLAIGAGLATLVAVYQAVFDLGFMNPESWAALRRASGTLMDANPFGMMAAIWGGIGVALLLAVRRLDSEPTGQLAAACAVLAASWCGLWVSGSRTALLAGGFLFLFAARALAPMALRVSRRRLAPLFLVAVVLGGGALAASGSAVGPWQRLERILPSASIESLRGFGRELWERNRYGTVSTRAIADSPIVGVGVGSFNMLVPDLGFEMGYGRLPTDNAQNWFRHRLAEFGILGSLGWIVWVALFLHLLVRGRPRADLAASASIVRGVLVALGLVSLVGMPTQVVSLALTFWALAFWYHWLVSPQTVELPRTRLSPTAVWSGVWVLAFVYSAGLAAVSWSDLRVPSRAQRANWDYSYGFHDLERDAAGEAFRWAGRRAVAVVPLRDRWIEMKAWAHHRDLAERPLELEIRVDGAPLIDTVLRDDSPVIEAVRLPEGQTRVLIETAVDRTWRPSNHGEQDSRDLGPGVQWRFIDP